MRIYYEVTQANEYYVPWSSVPCGLSYFPGEIASLPKTCVLAIILLLSLTMCAGGRARQGTLSSSRSTRQVVILQRTSSQRHSRGMCAQCSERAGLRSVSSPGRLGMIECLHMPTGFLSMPASFVVHHGGLSRQTIASLSGWGCLFTQWDKYAEFS